MLIFKDVITDDEMISDSYDLKEVDGIVFEADCAMIEEGGVSVGKPSHTVFQAWDEREIWLKIFSTRHWCQRLRRRG